MGTLKKKNKIFLIYFNWRIIDLCTLFIVCMVIIYEKQSKHKIACFIMFAQAKPREQYVKKRKK